MINYYLRAIQAALIVLQSKNTVETLQHLLAGRLQVGGGESGHLILAAGHRGGPVGCSALLHTSSEMLAHGAPFYTL